MPSENDRHSDIPEAEVRGTVEEGKKRVAQSQWKRILNIRSEERLTSMVNNDESGRLGR